MAAVMRIDIEAVHEICSEAGVSLAAENGTGQYVISGTADAVETAVKIADERGGKCRHLDVAGAFHSPLMASAAEPLRDALADVTLSRPTIEFWSTTTASVLTEPSDIRVALVEQLTAGVRWRETITSIAEGHAGPFVDLGPGRVVGGLTRRIATDAEIRYAADLLPANAGGDA